MRFQKLPDWQVDLVLKALQAGAPASHAADAAGCCTGTALRIARAHGLPVAPRGGNMKGRTPANAKPPEIRERALLHIRRGATLRAAGAAAGVSHETVNQWAKHEGVTVKRSDANFAKLRRKALRLILAGEPDRVVNQKLGVTAASYWRREAGIYRGASACSA